MVMCLKIVILKSITTEITEEMHTEGTEDYYSAWLK